MAPRFDRYPFVVAFYSLKLLLEICSVINVKKNVSNTRSPSFGASIPLYCTLGSTLTRMFLFLELRYVEGVL